MGSNRDEILNLLYTYAERVDSGDAEGTAELFRHAEIKWGVDAPVLFGYEAVLKIYHDFIRVHSDGTPRTHHLVTNAIIDIDSDGKTAKARSYYTVIQQTEKTPLQVIAGGRYHDQLEKVEGQWRLKRRDFFMDFRGNISDHVFQREGLKT